MKCWKEFPAVRRNCFQANGLVEENTDAAEKEKCGYGNEAD